MQLKGNLLGSTFKQTLIISQSCSGVSDQGSARNPQNAVGTRPPQSNPSPSVHFYTGGLTATWAFSGRALERHLLYGFKTGRVNGVWGFRPAGILRSALRCRRSMDHSIYGALKFNSQQGSPCHPLRKNACSTQGLGQFFSNSNGVIMPPRLNQRIWDHLHNIPLIPSHF